MTIVRESSSEIIAQFTVPFRGTWRNIAINTIPLDAVFDSMNVFIREGKLGNRPGLTLLSDTVFAEPVIGGAMITTPNEKTILAFTRQIVYQLNNSLNTWSPIQLPSNSSISIGSNAVVDITFMETAGKYVALIASEGYALKKWTGPPYTVTALTGTNIPKAKSTCTAASRIIALVPPHTIVWSNTLNPEVFDANAYAKRAQTGDTGICVKSLSALSFVLYKERSIHMARAQAGLDESTAFAFSEPLYVEGPAGIYACIAIGGTHYYMTKNGRIANFNATSYPVWIADGLWFFLQKDINQTFAHQIRAVYDYRLHTITFFYPQVNNPPGLKGMVVINLPLEGIDTGQPQQPHAFLGTCEKPISHACEKRFDGAIDRSILFSQQSGTINDSQAFVFDEDSDADGGAAFDCSFQTGLVAMPNGRHTMVSVESFLERGFGYGNILIEPVISDTLESATGTIPDLSAQSINLETNPVCEYKGFGHQVRFFGLRYSWQSSSRVRYSGTVVYDSALNKNRK